MPRQPQRDDTGLDVEFFGPLDRDKNGNISAEYPCWMNSLQIENMEDDVRLDEFFLKQSIDPANKAQRQASLDDKRKKLREINQCMPILKGEVRAKAEQARTELADKVAEAYFNTSEMAKGGANTVMQEAKRMTEFMVGISPQTAAFAVKCNVPFTKDYKVMRPGAEKMYQIISRALGEDPDLEALRKVA